MTRGEAIKELRCFLGQLTEGCQEIIKVLIPELREGEDERIRQGMIRFLNSEKAESIFTYEARQSWIAYLEKQKEQKPEVKFTGWVARDRNGELWVYGAYPEKDSVRQLWVGSNSMILDHESFPNLKWEDEPVEVEITITRKPS